MADGDIDLDAGLFIAPAAMPEKARTSDRETVDSTGSAADTGQYEGFGDPGEHSPSGGESSSVHVSGDRRTAVSFVANRKNVYEVWNALADLAEMTGAISIKATATATEGYDRAKLEHGVLGPLREPDLLQDDGLVAPTAREKGRAYLTRLQLANYGPLQNLDIRFPFDGEPPKPVLLVGESGSRKS